MANGMIMGDCLQNDNLQFDNFISIHTKQLVLGLTAFFSSKFRFVEIIAPWKCA